MSTIRYAAVAAAILSSTAALQAQTVTTTTTTVERSARPLELLPEQRTTIYRAVTRERRVAQSQGEVVEYRVGRRVPSTVVLEEFPREVYVEAPALERYRYFYVNNQLVLVDPATSQVVDILDR